MINDSQQRGASKALQQDEVHEIHSGGSKVVKITVNTVDVRELLLSLLRCDRVDTRYVKKLVAFAADMLLLSGTREDGMYIPGDMLIIRQERIIGMYDSRDNILLLNGKVIVANNSPLDFALEFMGALDRDLAEVMKAVLKSLLKDSPNIYGLPE